MDELPPNAKAWLAKARAAERPPEGAEDRVRLAVMLAVGVGAAATTAASHAAASTAGAAAKASWLAGSTLKLATVSGMFVAAGATAVVLNSTPSAAPAPATRSVPAPVAPRKSAQHEPMADQAWVEPVSVPEPETTAATDPHPVRVRRHGPATATHSPASTLQAEVTLLAQASAALEHGDARTAHALLTRHSTLFPQGQLAPERHGLSVLEACVAGRAHAPRAARRYLRSASDAVLAARIARACELEDTP